MFVFTEQGVIDWEMVAAAAEVEAINKALTYVNVSTRKSL